MASKKEAQPSVFFLKLFLWFCDPRIAEDIEGDLLERFETRLQKLGQRKAKWLFIKEVVLLFRPGIIRNFKGIQKLNNYDMLKNYFKTAHRNLLKQKMYSSIKIGGFALGIAACLLIGLFIKNELAYDQHYENKDRLYRVIQTVNFAGDPFKMAWMPAPYAKALQEEFPEIEKVGRLVSGGLFGAGTNQLRSATEFKNSNETSFTFADSSMLDLFEMPMIYGDAHTALAEANTMVISKAKAEKFFPGKNPIGELMILNENTDRPLKVTGVMDDPKGQSHFQYDFVLSLTGREFFQGEQNFWGANNYPTYFRLKENATVANLEAKIHDIATKYVLPYQESQGFANAQKFVDDLIYEVQPVSDIYLRSEGTNDPFSHGNMGFIWLFGAIAVLILVIATINFINLSTAKSANRAMEVGLRKAIGSQRGDLITQFLVESVLFSLLSFAIGVLLASLLLPYFNEMAGKTLELPIASWWFVPGLLVSALFTGLLAGIYPAFYLSSFRPIQVLKGSLALGSKKSGLRGVLVIFQFTTSVALIIATLVVSRQMNFILNTELGFEKDQIVMLEGTNTLGDRVNTLKSELQNLSAVKSVTVSGYLPVDGTIRNGNLWWNKGRTQIDNAIPAQVWRVDHDYVSTLGINLLTGRDFSKEMASDSTGIIINETLARDMGFTDPLGRKITNDANNINVYNIIGVIEDFHYESLKGEIEGLGLVLGNSTSMVTVKLNSTDMQGAMAAITDTWKRVAPEQPIAYDFMDQRFATMYNDVQRTGQIFTSFAVFAIFVACLGLFGLSVFMIEQRNKEISIRLVLGASIDHVLKSLAINFLKPVLISLVIAVPIAAWLMKDWLSEFQYKIDLSWDIFAIAGLIALVIAVITVGYQSTKAALMKPVNGLRND